MHVQPEASKAVCRVCGDVRSLGTEAGQAAKTLAAFTAQHSVHDRFRIDVVTGRVRTADGKVWRLPLQRDTSPEQQSVRSA